MFNSNSADSLCKPSSWQATLELIDLNPITKESSLLTEAFSRSLALLKSKLRPPMKKGFFLTKKRKEQTKNQDVNLSFYHTIQSIDNGENNERLTNPSDVKISYHANCIITSHYSLHKIQFFDLTTKEFILALKSPMRDPKWLCVEEDYIGNERDALIFNCETDKCVYKYDLQNILDMSNRSELSQTEPECKYLWKSQPLNQVEGMLIHNYEHDGKCLFVCDPGLSEIRILNLKTGDVLGSIKTQEKPYGIASTSLDGDLMITVFHQVLVLQKNNSGEYFTKNIIEKPHESRCVFSFPYSLVVDSISQQLMVMDSDEGKIHVLSLKDGTELICFNGPSDNAFSDYSFSLSLSGACLNEYSGELFVCDFYSQRVLIFKN